MIYTERISDNKGIFFIERHKNDENTHWYYISIGCDDKDIADNADWISSEFLTLKKKEVLAELDYEISKEDIKQLRSLVKEAINLGWFKKPSKVYPDPYRSCTTRK